MKRTSSIVLLLLAAWLPSSPVCAADTPPSANRNMPVDETTFKTLDINGDGYISRDEIRRATNLERQFDQLDSNHDGRLSREELRGMFPIERPADAGHRK